MFGATTDKPEKVRAFAESLELDFPILSDPTKKTARAYGKCHFVVTSRPQAYVEEVVLAGFEQARIAPLDPKGVATFLDHWCAALFPHAPETAEERRA